jgi:hypothetical protein
MPADFSEYVNLKIFDKEPGDIYRDSIELARLSLPEFNLRIGTPEDAIFQAMAYVSALNIATINRIPDRLMAGIVSLLGFQRQEAVAAEVDVEVTLGSYEGGIIPSGTVFAFESIFEDEVQQFAFRTTSATIIPEVDIEETEDYPSEIVTVTCLTPGVIPPLGDGEELTIVSSGTDIFSVVTATPSNFANGINEDTDADYLSKASTYLRSLTSALVRPSQVDAYLLTSYPGIIARARTYDLTDSNTVFGDITVPRVSGVVKTYLEDDLATIQTNAPHLFIVGDTVKLEVFDSSVSATFNGTHIITGTSEDTISFVNVGSDSASTIVTGSAYAGIEKTGYISIFAYGINNFLTSLQKSNITEDVVSKSIAGLRLEIVDPSLVSFEVSGAVTVLKDYDLDAVKESVESALIEYFSPNNYPFSYDRIRLSQVISIISGIPGIYYVDSINLSSIGDGWLPQYGTDLLFLNKGTLPLLSLDDIDISFTMSEVM